MKDWLSNQSLRWLVVTLICCQVFLGLAVAQDAKKMQAAQNALAKWDVAQADLISQDLLASDPRSDDALYLRGAVLFFQGEYGQAAAVLAKVKNLKFYERDDSGYFSLSKEILSQNIKFKERSSGNFRVRFHDGVDEVMVGRLLDRMEKVRASIGEALDYFPKEKVLIEIYPSADAFIAASPLTKEHVKTSGTIALCKYGRILLTTPRSVLRGYPWVDTVSHEYVHYVIARKWGPNVPIWMHEGLAKFLEERWRSKASLYLSPSFENLLAQAVRKKDFVTFEEMYPSFAMLPSAERAQLAYAQVASIVDFIVSKKGGFETIMKMLDRLAQGKDLALVFQEVFGGPAPVFLDEWKAWLADKKLKELGELDPMTLQLADEKTRKKEQSIDQFELSQIEAPNVREFLHLGDLLRYRGRNQAALIEYEKAQATYKKPSPVIATKLARIYNETKAYGKARAVLSDVILLYPEFGLPFELMGDAHWGEGDVAKACEFYGRAIEINPFNPKLYTLLAEGLGRLGNAQAKQAVKSDLEILSRHQ